jgi:predicted alpha/beta-hydrolase family hydrolase
MPEAFEAPGVRGTLHRPDTPNHNAIALTHGAGSNSDAKLLVRLAEAFAGHGYLVLRYDLPFRQQRPGGSPFPAGAARDREGIAMAVDALRPMVSGRIFAGGHSYGGRQTTMVATERSHLADALLLLSYPLHPPKRPEQLRTAHFPQLHTPALFVHGNRDPFGTLDEMRQALALVPGRHDLLPVEKAGHDLGPAGQLAEEILSRLTALL